MLNKIVLYNGENYKVVNIESDGKLTLVKVTGPGCFSENKIFGIDKSLVSESQLKTEWINE